MRFSLRAAGLKRSTQSAETGMEQGPCGKADVRLGNSLKGARWATLLAGPNWREGGPQDRPHHHHAKLDHKRQ